MQLLVSQSGSMAIASSCIEVEINRASLLCFATTAALRDMKLITPLAGTPDPQV
jgi:hypothetical protein